MADQEAHRGLLWMFRRRPPAGAGGGAALDPSGSLYTHFKNTQNPFLKRAIAPGARLGARSAREMSRLVKFLGEQSRYQVAPANRADPFRRRKLEHPAPPPSRAARFLGPAGLSGDAQRLPFMVDDFFRSTLERLRADPQSFAFVVQDLVALFREHGIALRVYEAYHAFEDWDDLMDTLAEIARYPSVETFDLFCSALLAYHDLVYGPAPG